MPPKLLVVALAVPLAVGALAGCGGSASGGDTAPVASTASAREASAADFALMSEMPDPVPVATTQWNGSEWAPLASPGNLNGSKDYPNGIVLTPGQPVSVPLETKDGLERTFVLKILDERVTVKMQGSTCIGLSRTRSSGQSGVFSSSAQLPGARLSCMGSGMRLRPIPPPA